MDHPMGLLEKCRPLFAANGVLSTTMMDDTKALLREYAQTRAWQDLEALNPKDR
jgi:hypothetical protein